VELNEVQIEGLKRLAAERGVSVSELVRQGVDMLLSGDLGEEQRELTRRALAAAKALHSGPPRSCGPSRRPLRGGVRAVTVYMDTSAVLAVVDADVPEHARARPVWGRLLCAGARLHASNYSTVKHGVSGATLTQRVAQRLPGWAEWVSGRIVCAQTGPSRPCQPPTPRYTMSNALLQRSS